MKTKTIQFIPVILTFAGFISAPISYWCIYSNGYCYGTLVHQVYPYFINPLYSFSLFVLPIAIILVFVSRNIFNSWLKLAAWMLPLSIIFIALVPVSSNAPFQMFSFYRDDAARLAGEVFAAASLVLIIWKFFAARHI